MQEQPFWQVKLLNEMSDKEWESLCDGCAKCCLVKLEDEETDQVFYTNVACQLLDIDTCRCSDYQHRLTRVSECLRLSANDFKTLNWLPITCAYRLIHEGKALFDWHPLVSGDKKSVHEAGQSVQDKVLSAANVHQEELEEHIIRWVK